MTRIYPSDGSGGLILEGQAQRYPIDLNEPTTSRVARNESIEKTLIQERKDNVVTVPTVTGQWEEPKTKYDAVFPYDRVTETESGHLLEVDDTTGKERLSNAHRSGTFEEVHPDGSKVTKVFKDNYQVIMKDDHVYVMGKCYLTVQGDLETFVEGNMKTHVKGNYDINVDGNFKVTAARIDLN